MRTTFRHSAHKLIFLLAILGFLVATPVYATPTVAVSGGLSLVVPGEDISIEWDSGTRTCTQLQVSATLTSGDVDQTSFPLTGESGAVPYTVPDDISLDTDLAFALICAGAGGTGGTQIGPSIEQLQLFTNTITLNPTTGQPNQAQLIQWSASGATRCTDFRLTGPTGTDFFGPGENGDGAVSGTAMVPAGLLQIPGSYSVRITCVNDNNGLSVDSNPVNFTVEAVALPPMNMRVWIDYNNNFAQVGSRMLPVGDGAACTSQTDPGCFCDRETCSYSYQALAGEDAARTGTVRVMTDSAANAVCELDGSPIEPSTNITLLSSGQFISSSRLFTVTCWQILNGNRVNENTQRVIVNFLTADTELVDPTSPPEGDPSVQIIPDDTTVILDPITSFNWTWLYYETANVTACGPIIERRPDGTFIERTDTVVEPWGGYIDYIEYFILTGTYTYEITCEQTVGDTTVIVSDSVDITVTASTAPPPPTLTFELVSPPSPVSDTVSAVTVRWDSEHTLWCAFSASSDQAANVDIGALGSDVRTSGERTLQFANTGALITIFAECGRDAPHAASVLRQVQFQLPASGDLGAGRSISLRVLDRNEDVVISQIPFNPLFNGALIRVGYDTVGYDRCVVLDEVAPDGTRSSFTDIPTDLTSNIRTRTLSQLGTYRFELQCSYELVGFTSQQLSGVVSAEVEVTPGTTPGTPTASLRAELVNDSETSQRYDIIWESEHTTACDFTGIDLDSGQPIELRGGLQSTRGPNGSRGLTFSKIGRSYEIRVVCSRPLFDDLTATDAVTLDIPLASVHSEPQTAMVEVRQAGTNNPATILYRDPILGLATADIFYTSSDNAMQCIVLSQTAPNGVTSDFAPVPTFMTQNVTVPSLTFDQSGTYIFEVVCGRPIEIASFKDVDFSASPPAFAQVQVEPPLSSDSPTASLTVTPVNPSEPPDDLPQFSEYRFEWGSTGAAYCFMTAVNEATANSINLNFGFAPNGEGVRALQNTGDTIEVTLTCGRTIDGETVEVVDTATISLGLSQFADPSLGVIPTDPNDDEIFLGGAQVVECVLNGTTIDLLTNQQYWNANGTCRRRLPDLNPNSLQTPDPDSWQANFDPDTDELTFDAVTYQIDVINQIVSEQPISFNDTVHAPKGYVMVGESTEYSIDILYGHSSSEAPNISEGWIAVTSGNLPAGPNNWLPGQPRQLGGDLNNVPPGAHTVRVTIDRRAGVNGVNQNVIRYFDLSIDFPPPSINLTVSPTIVRSEGDVRVTWDISNVSYPLECRLTGPGVAAAHTTNWFEIDSNTSQGDITINPRNAGDVTIQCREAVSQVDTRAIVGQAEQFVEVIPPLLEI